MFNMGAFHINWFSISPYSENFLLRNIWRWRMEWLGRIQYLLGNLWSGYKKAVKNMWSKKKAEERFSKSCQKIFRPPIPGIGLKYSSKQTHLYRKIRRKCCLQFEGMPRYLSKKIVEAIVKKFTSIFELAVWNSIVFRVSF